MVLPDPFLKYILYGVTARSRSQFRSVNSGDLLSGFKTLEVGVPLYIDFQGVAVEAPLVSAAVSDMPMA